MNRLAFTYIVALALLAPIAFPNKTAAHEIGKQLLSLRLFHRLFPNLIRSRSAEVSRSVSPGGILVEAGTTWAA